MKKNEKTGGKYGWWASLILMAVCLAVLMIFPPRAWAVSTTIPVGGTEFDFDLPQGYSVFQQNGNAVISNGSEIVGGVIAYPIPAGVYDPYDKWYFWLEDVGIPDYEDETLMQDGAMSDFGDGWYADFRRLPEGDQLPPLARSHHFDVLGDVVYDTWINAEITGEDAARELLWGIGLGASLRQYKTVTLNIEGEEVPCKLEQIVRRGYTVYLPESGWPFGSQEVLDGILTDTLEYGENEDIWLHIATLAGKDLAAAQRWVRANWPQYDLVEDKQGGLGGMDGRNNLLEASFYTAENVTYALIQAYPMEAFEGAGAWLRACVDTFTLNQGAGLSQEEADYLKCAAVMGKADFSGEDGRWISCRRECNGIVTTTQYLWDEDRGMVITETDQDGFYRKALLAAEDTIFSNAGHEDETGEILWQPCEEPGWVVTPVMVTSAWNRHSTRYLGRRADETGECISYIVIGYDDDGDKTPVRSVKFYFDAQGEFTQCRWESLADWANEFTTSTESFVSLDGQTVSAEIHREYLRAVG